MTRSMGDATHDNVSALVADRGNLQLVAGYVTGTSSIQWTPSDWASFPGMTLVTIDQGAYGSPVAAADVRDVESGAWTAAAAVDRSGWTAVRPTIYISLDSLPSLQSAGWQGDVWVADYTGTVPSGPPSMPAGMTCVAWQYTDLGGGGAYDLSVVFDPTWPSVQEAQNMLIIGGPSGAIYLLSGGRLHHIVDPTSVAAYRAAGVAYCTGITAAEETQLNADFPAGQPVVTIPPVSATVGAMTIAGTLTPEA